MAALNDGVHHENLKPGSRYGIWIKGALDDLYFVGEFVGLRFPAPSQEMLLVFRAHRVMGMQVGIVNESAWQITEIRRIERA